MVVHHQLRARRADHCAALCAGAENVPALPGGPEGGIHGGNIVAQGTPEEVAQVEQSWTGKYLKKALATSK